MAIYWTLYCWLPSFEPGSLSDHSLTQLIPHLLGYKNTTADYVEGPAKKIKEHALCPPYLQASHVFIESNWVVQPVFGKPRLNVPNSLYVLHRLGNSFQKLHLLCNMSTVFQTLLLALLENGYNVCLFQSLRNIPIAISILREDRNQSYDISQQPWMPTILSH